MEGGGLVAFQTFTAQRYVTGKGQVDSCFRNGNGEQHAQDKNESNQLFHYTDRFLSISFAAFEFVAIFICVESFGF